MVGAAAPGVKAMAIIASPAPEAPVNVSVKLDSVPAGKYWPLMTVYKEVAFGEAPIAVAPLAKLPVATPESLATAINTKSFAVVVLKAGVVMVVAVVVPLLAEAGSDTLASGCVALTPVNSKAFAEMVVEPEPPIVTLVSPAEIFHQSVRAKVERKVAVTLFHVPAGEEDRVVAAVVAFCAAVTISRLPVVVATG